MMCLGFPVSREESSVWWTSTREVADDAPSDRNAAPEIEEKEMESRFVSEQSENPSGSDYVVNCVEVSGLDACDSTMISRQVWC